LELINFAENKLLMEASINVDDRLLDEAKQLSHNQNTEEVIQQALERYVSTLKGYQGLLSLRGKVAFWDDEPIR
jgi:Bacterial antitoxin of type II TA system, VapB